VCACVLKPTQRQVQDQQRPWPQHRQGHRLGHSIARGIARCGQGRCWSCTCRCVPCPDTRQGEGKGQPQRRRRQRWPPAISRLALGDVGWRASHTQLRLHGRRQRHAFVTCRRSVLLTIASRLLTRGHLLLDPQSALDAGQGNVDTLLGLSQGLFIFLPSSIIA
jgi:hypothetical protein